nr:PREDICTED: protein SLX4IP isoform X3 [Anolis carolinensis]|eukprot:XP_016851535.1 PREDICTED: protein SLX4IP isoform X3 [Anolis carolinensis]
MTSHKLAIKCGNYAVLVDVHIMPQDSNKDNVWFSDHRKEEIFMLLKETLDSRVAQYLSTHKRPGQSKQVESTKETPLFLQAFYIDICALSSLTKKADMMILPLGLGTLKASQAADDFYIEAYFVKRWVNLRCIWGQQNSELRVFPDRFVICVTRLESSPLPWETLSSGTSEYFGESAGEGLYKISLTQQEKQNILKEIVKRTKATKTNESQPQPSKDTMKVYLGSLCSDRK